MALSDQLTPLLITFNEESNLSRTLAALTWAPRVLVIDSHSTDSTLLIAARHPNVEVVLRRFDTFAQQCNHGLSLIRTPWCLSLDADHLITPAFLAELEGLMATCSADTAAILTPFRYLVAGRPLRGTLLPPRFNVVRPGRGLYLDDGHAHRFAPRGPVRAMKQPILHDDRKPLCRWLSSQHSYLRQEVAKLTATPAVPLSLPDRLRQRYFIAPIAVPLICLIWHRGLLDGWRGWFYALQRLYVETLLSLMLLEARLLRSAQVSADD